MADKKKDKKSNVLSIPAGNIMRVGELIAGQVPDLALAPDRNRLLRILSDEVNVFEQSRLEILKKYAKKDADNNPVMVEREGNSHYEIDNDHILEANNEMTNLVFGEVNFDVTNANKGMWKNLLVLLNAYSGEIKKGDTEIVKHIEDQLK